MSEKQKRNTVTLRKSLLLLAVAAVCFFFVRSLLQPEKIRNVILISIDTCRADHLSCYGYPCNTTPNIDAVAKEGFLFENAISPIPQTLPAHTSMLCGTIPPYHGVHDNDGYRVGQSNLSIAEILQQKGFTTGAIVSTFILNSRFDMNQGFDSYDDKFEEKLSSLGFLERRGLEATERANKWLEKQKDEDFFLFLHYYDPHSQYIPPEPFATEYKDDPYAGEIAYTDYCIGLVLKKLKELKLYDSSLIIITADHGEMLKEHGERTHGYYIYQSAVKVPLIIKLPNQREGRRISQTVGLIDIMPTICSLLGFDVPADIQGIDLSPAFSGRKLSKQQRYLYCESLYPTKYGASSLLGIVTDRWKYIQTTRPELYDIVEDPYENTNLIRKHPQQARILQDKLKQILEQTVSSSKKDSKMELSDEAKQRLEALGYVTGAVTEEFEFDQTKEDPKNLIAFHVLLAGVPVLIQERQYAIAKSVCRELISVRPKFFWPYFDMGDIALAEGELDEALKYLNKAMELNPREPKVHNRLADVFRAQDKKTQAVDHYEISLTLNPRQPAVLVSLSEVYFSQGKIKQALESWEKIIEFESDQPEILNNLAWHKAVYKDESYYNPAKAVEYGYRACELLDFKNSAAMDTLAVAYAAAGDFAKARQTAQKAIDLAEAADQQDMAEGIKKRLKLFKLGKPYYE
ncbi:MAG: sulfatase-like hydrolase/transferase [Planctomycetes bacterium]|nr:sulfatase-like hydrolase/transferase [Planctomycetota bacterium]